MQTILDELLHEAFEAPGCHNGNCSCHSCAHKRQEFGIIQQGVQNMELALNAEEEYEFGKAIEKVKSLLKKGYRKASPIIAAGNMIWRLVNPNTDIGEPPARTPIEMNDQGRFIEEEKKRRREEQIRQAEQQKKRKWLQKPDPETTILQEIFQEQEAIADPTFRYGSTGKQF